ncbi:MAG: hypothetical protein AB7T08_10845 [Hyphomonadaceae bacterium]
MLRRLAAAATLLLVVGCGEPHSNVSGAAPQAAPAAETAAQVLYAQYFSSAAAARLFVYPRDDYDMGTPPHLPSRDGRLLTAAQRREIDAHFRFRAPSPDEEPPAAYACAPIPHHIIRYYSTDGAVLGDLAICFCCDTYLTSPRQDEPGEPYVRDVDFQALRRSVEGMGVSTNVSCGGEP